MANSDLNIFCVDDDSAYQRYVSHSIGEQYNLQHMESGEECVERTQTELVDLILISTPLKGMSANEVCEFIKDDPMLNQVPIIFLSDLNSKSDKNNAFKSGGDDYIQKSSSPNELKSIVEMALEEDLAA